MTVYVNDPNHPVGAQGESKAAPGGKKPSTPEEDSFVDQYLKLRRQKQAEMLINQEMGLTEGKVEKKEGNQPDNPPVEPLQNQLIRAVFDNNTKSNDQYIKLAERNDQAAEKARDREDKAKSDANALVATQIGGALESLRKMQEELRTTGGIQKTVDDMKALKELMGVMQPQPANAYKEPTTDPTIAANIEQMRLNHDLLIKRMDLEMKKMDQDLSIRLAEFQENRQVKEREYADSQRFRESAFSTVNDLAVAASAGFANRVESGIAAEVKTPRPEAPAAEVKDVETFDCEDCKTPIAVLAGVDKVTCTKCGMQYSIKH